MPPWPDLSATQSRREGLQDVSNVVFNGHGFHWGGWPVLSLAASPSTELRIQSTHSELSRLGGHQFGDRRDLNWV